MTRHEGSIGAAIAALALLAVVLFAVRVSAPSTLTDNDQERAGAYVVDAVVNGHWAVQRDWNGDITSKPPLYTWLAAGTSLVAGRPTLLTLYLPCLLAILGIVWLIVHHGQRYFGLAAGALAAMTLLVSGIGAKQLALARTDSLFGFVVFALTLLGWHAWYHGRSWVPFWLMAAAATLTKGPLGIVLGAGGLLVALWHTSPAPRPGRLRQHLTGLALFVLLVGGWFALAWLDAGQALVDRMIGKELVGHMLTSDDGEHGIASQVLKPTLYFFTRFAPWSLVAAWAVWNVFRRPAASADARCFERYLVCALAVGMAIFSLAPHQRPDHLYPLIPVAALLAGHQLSRWLSGWPARRVRVLAGSVAMLGVMLLALNYHVRVGAEPVVRDAELARAMARDVEAMLGPGAPIMHTTDTRYALQFHLGTMTPVTSIAEAAQALRGPAPVVVAVREHEALASALGPLSPALHELGRWEAPAAVPVTLVANRPCAALGLAGTC